MATTRLAEACAALGSPGQAVPLAMWHRNSREVSIAAPSAARRSAPSGRAGADAHVQTERMKEMKGYLLAAVAELTSQCSERVLATGMRIAPLLSLALLALPGLAPMAEAGAFCRADVARLCPNVEPGDNRIVN